MGMPMAMSFQCKHPVIYFLILFLSKPEAIDGAFYKKKSYLIFSIRE